MKWEWWTRKLPLEKCVASHHSQNLAASKLKQCLRLSVAAPLCPPQSTSPVALMGWRIHFEREQASTGAGRDSRSKCTSAPVDWKVHR